MKVNCRACGCEFNKLPSEIKKTPNHYCSRSCSAKVNNKIKPKRKKEGKCKGCNVEINSSYTWCGKCWKHRTLGRSVCNKTKLELTIKNGGGNTYRKIRNHARIVANKVGLLKKPCKCGYAKHVELCHIKSIKSFPDDALASEINHIDNLVQLCRNCHWEFDN